MTDEERYDIMFDEIYDLKAENKALQEKINNQCDSCACEIANERDRIKADLERVTAERDKAVGDLQKLISRLRGKCNFCKNKDHFLKLEEPCVSCNKVIKQSYEFEGLEESE